MSGLGGDDVLIGGGGRDTFIFTEGSDRIADFSQYVDEIGLSGSLIFGKETIDDVFDQYASVMDGNIVFDFGDGNILSIDGVDNLEVLVGSIEIF